MTNTAGHSDSRAHCSLCPDGPWSKSAQAEADFQYKAVGATVCLPFCTDVAQAPALNSSHSSLSCAWCNRGWCVCVHACMCVYTCHVIASDSPRRAYEGFAVRGQCRPDPSLLQRPALRFLQVIRVSVSPSWVDPHKDRDCACRIHQWIPSHPAAWRLVVKCLPNINETTAPATF